jgi:hypothetical protein
MRIASFNPRAPQAGAFARKLRSSIHYRLFFPGLETAEAVRAIFSEERYKFVSEIPRHAGDFGIAGVDRGNGGKKLSPGVYGRKRPGGVEGVLAAEHRQHIGSLVLFKGEGGHLQIVIDGGG